MDSKEMDERTLATVQELIEANLTRRDELYAAAASLDDRARQHVCRRLAEHLAGHAAELEQLVTIHGAEPAQPLDIESIASALFRLAKANRGDAGVLEAAAEGERHLIRDYDSALEGMTNHEAKNALRRQSEYVEFGEQVLCAMNPDRTSSRSSAPE